MIFSLIGNRLKKMRIVTEVLDSAGRVARENGSSSPGSEHLLLAALDKLSRREPPLPKNSSLSGALILASICRERPVSLLPYLTSGSLVTY